MDLHRLCGLDRLFDDCGQVSSFVGANGVLRVSVRLEIRANTGLHSCGRDEFFLISASD